MCLQRRPCVCFPHASAACYLGPAECCHVQWSACTGGQTSDQYASSRSDHAQATVPNVRSTSEHAWIRGGIMRSTQQWLRHYGTAAGNSRLPIGRRKALIDPVPRG